MPLLLDRRSFLRSTAAGLTLLTGQAKAAKETARLALISDTHIAADASDSYRGFSPHKNLTQVIEQVGRMPFDLCIVNGDLARKTGEVADYSAFVTYFDPLADKMPALITLGNHDDRKNARSAVDKRAGEVQPVEQKLVTTLDAGPFTLVLLDSLMATNVSQGQLGHNQREWLTRYLDSQAAKPQVVFVHHNPDPDNDGALVDADRLLAILRPRRQVKALFFGHMHVYTSAQQDGLHLINLPATGYNFADGNPVGWVEATFTARGAQLKLHAVAGEMTHDGQTKTLNFR